MVHLNHFNEKLLINISQINIKVKYYLFVLTKKILPKKVYHLIGASNLTQLFRDLLFRKNNLPLIHSMFLKWHHYKLYFQAPLQIMHRAKSRGIEPSLTSCILKLIDNGDQIIDIGSSYGFISLIVALRLQNSGGKVFAFESEKFVYDIFSDTIKKNGLSHTIEAHNIFVWSNDKLDKKTIDTILLNTAQDIKLIKIDTDGSDYDCLIGCKSIIKKYSPIIIIEVNNYGDKILQWLRKNGYEFFYDQHFRIIDKINYPPNLLASCKSIV